MPEAAPQAYRTHVTGLRARARAPHGHGVVLVALHILVVADAAAEHDVNFILLTPLVRSGEAGSLRHGMAYGIQWTVDGRWWMAGGGWQMADFCIINNTG